MRKARTNADVTIGLPSAEGYSTVALSSIFTLPSARPPVAFKKQVFLSIAQEPAIPTKAIDPVSFGHIAVV
jgi:hypothetical protein